MMDPWEEDELDAMEEEGPSPGVSFGLSIEQSFTTLLDASLAERGSELPSWRSGPLAWFGAREPQGAWWVVPPLLVMLSGMVEGLEAVPAEAGQGPRTVRWKLRGAPVATWLGVQREGADGCVEELISLEEEWDLLLLCGVAPSSLHLWCVPRAALLARTQHALAVQGQHTVRELQMDGAPHLEVRFACTPDFALSGWLAPYGGRLGLGFAAAREQFVAVAAAATAPEARA